MPKLCCAGTMRSLTKAMTKSARPLENRLSFSSQPTRLTYHTTTDTLDHCGRKATTIARRAPCMANKLICKGLADPKGIVLEGTKREFSGTTRSCYKTVEEAKSRHRSGPFSWKAGVFFLCTGGGLVAYFRYEKARMERQRIAEATKGLGKPKVGGEFDLVNHDGIKFTDMDMKGKYALVYFGFTHCPDICPEELDKMAIMIDEVKEMKGDVMRPIFITCDPARDTPAVVKAYLKEFHPDIIGLTGTWENVKAICKAYRVYFSTPPSVKPGQDYLVDHSIYFYLMDPEGDFVEAIGRNFTPEQAAKIISDHIGDWRGKLDSAST